MFFLNLLIVTFLVSLMGFDRITAIEPLNSNVINSATKLEDDETMILENVPLCNGETYKSALLIRAVNWLHEKGRDNALQLLERYATVGALDESKKADQICLITRLLFLPKGVGRLRPLRLGL